MTKYCGKDLLIQIGDGAATEVFTTVGGFRSNGTTINNEQVDITDKGSSKKRELLACGINSMSISGSGLVSDNAALEAMKLAAHSGDIGNFKIISGLGDVYQGPFQVASFERTGEHNGAEEFSVSLESAAAITYTAPV
jgi:TP901-1 family phage major tail protein